MTQMNDPKAIEYIKLAMCDFDMDDSKWNDKEYILQNLKEYIQDDEKYVTFMTKLRSYKKYAGVEEDTDIPIFLSTMSDFSKNVNYAKVQDETIFYFQRIFRGLGFTLCNRLIVRDFKGDYYK